MQDYFDIICGGSLYWQTTHWQRPHQILSRLSRKRKVLYIRPLDWRIYRRDKASWPREKRFGSPGKNVHLFSPLILPFGRQIKFIRSLNNALMTSMVRHESREKGFGEKVLWLYSPLSNYLIDKLGEPLVIYDCMDEHAAFLNSDPALQKCEEQLLRRADLVFAGGRSLYESKRVKNKNCHFFPSAVDLHHFSKAMSGDVEIPADMERIPKPVAGYFGAVDERLDYALLDRLAAINPRFSFVLIGPILKVRKENLPRRGNIFFLGPREYSALPNYIKGFDVGLMPFAQTPLTRMISPTKTLEYLASGCRVVSTPIPDVIKEFSGIIRFGNDAGMISMNLKELVLFREEEKVKKGLEMASKWSWDMMVERMEKLIMETIGNGKK